LDRNKDKYLDRLSNRVLDTKYGSSSIRSAFIPTTHLCNYQTHCLTYLDFFWICSTTRDTPSRTSTRLDRDKLSREPTSSSASRREKDLDIYTSASSSSSRVSISRLELPYTTSSSLTSPRSQLSGGRSSSASYTRDESLSPNKDIATSTSTSSSSFRSERERTKELPRTNTAPSPYTKVAPTPRSLAVDTLYLESTIPSVATSSKWVISSNDLVGDDNTLVHVTDSIVNIWNLITQECKLVFNGHTSKVHSICLLHTEAQIHSKLVISSSTAETLIWTADDGNVIGSLPPSDAMTVGVLNTRTNDVFLICLAAANLLSFYVCNLKAQSRFASTSYRSKGLLPTPTYPTIELMLLKDVKDKSPTVRFTSVDFLPSLPGNRSIKLLVGVSNGSIGRVFVFDLSKSEFHAIEVPFSKPQVKPGQPAPNSTTAVRVLDAKFGVVSIGNTVSVLDLKTMICCSSREMVEPSR